MQSKKPSAKPSKTDVAVVKDEKLYAHATKLQEKHIAQIEEVEDFLTQDVGGQDGSERKIAKELFSTEGIKVRTDLSENHINSLTRLYFLADSMEDEDLRAVLDTFVTLRVSHKRKSRSEFIEALKGINDAESGGGFMNRFSGMFGGGGQ